MATLNLAAHQDDDLYFMSPDVLHDVAAGDARGTLYLTAGDAGGGWGSYAQGREAGAKAAWAQMMGVGSPTWTDTTIALAGRTVATSTLGGTSIRLTWLRLPDGGYGGDEASNPHYLAKLLDGTSSTVAAVDGSGSYTRQQLIDVLVAAIGLYGATLVRHHNHLDDFGSEHWDHTAAGRFAAEAVAACPTPPAHVGYLGYRTTRSWLWDNVSPTDQTAKRAAFAAYAPHDTQVSGSSWDNGWIPRQYPAGPFPTGTAGPTTRRIFATSDDSALGTNTDNTPTVIGMPFSVSADSLLTAITVMIPSAQNVAVTSQPVTAHLWTVTGTNTNYPDTYLGSSAGVTLVRGSRNTLALTVPIKLTAGQRYWACAYFPAGYYPRTASKFASAGKTSTDGRITTPANGTAPNNSYSQQLLPLFGLGASPPTAVSQAPWYGIDVDVADLVTSNTGTLNATLPKVTTSIAGQSVNPGSLAATTPAATASIAGQSINPGSLAAALPLATAAILGQSINPGTLAAVLPLVTAAIADAPVNQGTLNASLPKITANLIGQSSNPAALTVTLPLVAAAISGQSINQAVLAATVPVLLAALAGNSINPGSLAASVRTVTAAIAGQQTNPGTLTAILPLITFRLAAAIVWIIAAERTLRIAAEDRTLHIPAEDRTMRVSRT